MNTQLSTGFKVRLFFIKLFDQFCRLTRWRKFDKLVTRSAQQSNDFFFIQIGANDGLIYDPIFQHVKRFQWKGILVEPVPYYFEKLKKNYRQHSNLNFENVAISDKQEKRTFYRIQEGLDFLPTWCDGLGTFHLDVILSHKWAIPNIKDYVIEEEVKCISFNSLLEQYAVDKIDLLLIDTEGHDYHVIKQVDLERLKPGMIVYEHQHLSPTEKTVCESLLRQHGYSLAKHLGNTLAYLPPENRQPLRCTD